MKFSSFLKILVFGQFCAVHAFLWRRQDELKVRVLLKNAQRTNVRVDVHLKVVFDQNTVSTEEVSDIALGDSTVVPLRGNWKFWKRVQRIIAVFSVFTTADRHEEPDGDWLLDEFTPFSKGVARVVGTVLYQPDFQKHYVFDLGSAGQEPLLRGQLEGIQCEMEQKPEGGKGEMRQIMVTRKGHGPHRPPVKLGKGQLQKVSDLVCRFEIPIEPSKLERSVSSSLSVHIYPFDSTQLNGRWSTFLARILAKGLPFSSRRNCDDKCAICLDEMQVDAQHLTRLHPNNVPHTFHRDCLDRWFDAQMNCPECRREHARTFHVLPIFASSTTKGGAKHHLYADPLKKLAQVAEDPNERDSFRKRQAKHAIEEAVEQKLAEIERELKAKMRELGIRMGGESGMERTAIFEFDAGTIKTDPVFAQRIRDKRNSFGAEDERNQVADALLATLEQGQVTAEVGEIADDVLRSLEVIAEEEMHSQE